MKKCNGDGKNFSAVSSLLRLLNQQVDHDDHFRDPRPYITVGQSVVI